MEYALQLATYGKGSVAPNPLVGAVLVHEDQIIGSGYHALFGQAHAEVNCINSVPQGFKNKIKDSTLYVTLEPCNHHGKTPPCVDLILQVGIKKVVIACMDPFEKVNGAGVDRLKSHGVEVVIGVCEEQARFLNRRFFHFIKNRKPYIILKWAETKNGFIGNKSNERLYVTNASINHLVHTWRADEAAILVGNNTVLKDNPYLTVRNIKGINPIRILLDRNLKVSEKFHIFNKDAKTIVFNCHKNLVMENVEWIQLQYENFITEMLEVLYLRGIQSVLVEGGSKLLQSLIDRNLYDEIRCIKSANEGGDLRSPAVDIAWDRMEEHLGFQFFYYYNKINS